MRVRHAHTEQAHAWTIRHRLDCGHTATASPLGPPNKDYADCVTRWEVYAFLRKTSWHACVRVLCSLCKTGQRPRLGLRAPRLPRVEHVDVNHGRATWSALLSTRATSPSVTDDATWRSARPASVRASSGCSRHTPFASITKSLGVKVCERIKASTSRSTCGRYGSTPSLPTILPTCQFETVEMVAPHAAMWRLDGQARHGLVRLVMMSFRWRCAADYRSVRPIPRMLVRVRSWRRHEEPVHTNGADRGAMMHRHLLFRAFVVGVVFVAGGGVAVLAGCGTPAVASPEHIGTWSGSAAGGLHATITVAGTPDHYTAERAYAMPNLPNVPKLLRWEG
jgi:hypothetical protein